jgi:hypothetical protein
MSSTTRNLTLLVLAYLFVGAAAVTLLPLAAPMQNDLGYFSLCTFAPWSTLILLMVAGLFAAIRTYLISRKD